MDGLEKAKLKDRILQFLQDNPDGFFDAEEFYLKLDKPLNSVNHMLEIVNEIRDEAPKFVTTVKTDVFDVIASNDFTMEFLDNGGFEGEYNRQVEAAKKLNESIRREETFKELQEIELKQKIRYNTPSIVISSLSFAVAVASFLYTILQPKPESNDNRLEVIEARLDSLETSTTRKVNSVTIKKDTVK